MSLEVLYLRRPKIEYVSPPVCEGMFSGSGFPIIVLEPFGQLDLVTGLVLGAEGNGFRLSWNAYPGALCYNVYLLQDDGSYLLVAECIEDLFYFSLVPGTFRVSAITEDGETELSEPITILGPPPPCEEFIDDTHVSSARLPPDHGDTTPEGLVTGFRNVGGGIFRPWIYENRIDSDIRSEISGGSVLVSQAASDLVNTDGANFFEASHVGKYIKYDSGGVRVKVLAFISPTQVQVDVNQTVALTTFKIQGSTLGGNVGQCHRANSTANVIAGLETTPDELTFHLFWFNKATGEIRDIGSTDGITPEDITDAGHLLYQDNPGFAGQRAFIYNPLTMTSTQLTHTGVVVPNAMNESLVVTGFYDSGGDFHAFRWAAGIFTDIHPAAAGPGQESRGFFITDTGLILGEYRDTNFNLRVFFNNGGASSSIGDFGVMEDIQVFHCNQSGVAVGTAVIGGVNHAWRWNGTLQDLGFLPGAAHMTAKAINSDGWIIGDTNDLRIWLWIDGTFYNLIDLLPAGHGWTNLFFAHFITDDGMIAGRGTLGGVSTPFFCKICL